MQRHLPTLSTTQRKPSAPSATVLRQIESEAQAIDVSIAYSGCKALFVARSLGKSEAWVSQLRNGRKPLPVDAAKRARFVADFCRVTGTTLLADYLDLQEAFAEVRHARSQQQINRGLASQLRGMAA